METMKQFLAKLSEDGDDSSTGIYIRCIQRASDPAEWQELIGAPFSLENVIILADALYNEIAYRISRTSTEGLYHMRQKESHQLLRRF